MEIPAMDGFRETQVIGVSNGLICLAKRFPFDFVLWNPTIRRYARLPVVTKTRYGRFFIVGFGFDCSSNDFKVVNLIYRELDWFPDARGFDSAWVFSYATWSWKRLTSSILESCCIYDRSSPVFFNGVLHWIASHTKESDFILTFDLTREVFGQILPPSGAIPHRSGAFTTAYNSIATTGDSLLFIQKKFFCSIWSMKQYGKHESWTKTSSAFRRNMIPGSVLGARKNGDIIFEMGISRETGKYSPSTSTNVPVEAMEDTIFFHYHTETLYLLEKPQDHVNSY